MRNKIDKSGEDHQINKRFPIVLFLSLLLCCTACLEKEEGCLDITASNYNAATDTPCEDCCTYPSLELEIFHRFNDSLSLVYGDRYVLEGTDSIEINQIKFYLSEFQLENDTETKGVSDTIQVALQDGSMVTLEDNFNLISRDDGFSYDIGNISAQGTFNRISFYVGLTETPSQVVPSSLTNDAHPLAIQSDSFYTPATNSYIYNRISLITDTLFEDTVVYDILADQRVKVELDYDLVMDLGFDAVIPIKIDYAEWFKGIDFAAEPPVDPELIKAAIVSNTANAFSIQVE